MQGCFCSRDAEAGARLGSGQLSHAARQAEKRMTRGRNAVLRGNGQFAFMPRQEFADATLRRSVSVHRRHVEVAHARVIRRFE